LEKNGRGGTRKGVMKYTSKGPLGNDDRSRGGKGKTGEHTEKTERIPIDSVGADRKAKGATPGARPEIKKTGKNHEAKEKDWTPRKKDQRPRR